MLNKTGKNVEVVNHMTLSSSAASSALQVRMLRILTEGFCAADIAEPLCSFDGGQPGSEVAALLAASGVPAAGVDISGELRGIVFAVELDTRPLGEQLHPIADIPAMRPEAPLSEVVAVLNGAPACLLRPGVESAQIILRSDIQKPPVRMWLFGLITVLDMFLSRAIRRGFPEDSWQEYLSAGRLERARSLQAERLRRGQRTSLSECLQIKDKCDLLTRFPERLAEEGFESKRAFERLANRLESLRNSLAHAQDIIEHDWDAIVTISQRVTKIVGRIAQ